MIPATEAKTPRERITASVVFVRMLSCSCQMNGMGRRASRKSVVMLMTEVVSDYFISDQS